MCILRLIARQSNRIILPYEEKRNATQGVSPIWIGKPSNKSRGRGIKITPNLQELADHVALKEDDLKAENAMQVRLTREKD